MTAIEDISNIAIYDAMLPEIHEITERVNKGNSKTINNVQVYLENNSEVLELKQRQWMIGPVSSTCVKSMGLGAIYLLYRIVTGSTRLMDLLYFIASMVANPFGIFLCLIQKGLIVGGSSIAISYLWNVQTSKTSHEKVMELFNKALEKRKVNQISQTKLNKVEKTPDPIHCTFKVQVIQGSWLFGKTIDYETRKTEVLSARR